MKNLFLVLGFLLCIPFATAQTPEVRSLSFNPALKPFYHGVASGDPLGDRVIIWTRVTPDSGFAGAASVEWRMALDTGMTQIVQSGTHTTHDSVDYTVKVDVTGLSPNTYYYYEFTYNQKHSIRGRTRTTPVSMQDSLRFAVVSCSNYEAGFFNVYHVITERNDVDALIHLGDYIYEYEHNGYAFNSTANRVWEPSSEIITLADYRTRYSCYKLDDDLIRLHQQYPFIMVWDDHESANDSWMNGAENHDASEGPWIDRKRASQRAYMEWLPIRPRNQGNIQEIYRKINFGPLVDLLMLDTRLIGREQQSGTTGSTVNDPNRTLLGTTQYNWLTSNLMTNAVQWKVMAQQVMMAPLKVAGFAINGDQWDGYPAERNKIMSFVLANDIRDVAVLTGDIHCSWGNDIPTANYQSNGSGSAFVEFVTPSITSPGFPVGVGAGVVKLMNPHVKFVNLDLHGFILLDINQLRIQSDWFFVNTIDQASNGYTYGDSWYENHNERFLRHTSTVAFPRHDMDKIPAPKWPREYEEVIVDPPTSTQEEESAVVVGVYPNPFTEGISLQLYLPQASNVQLRLLDMSGRLLALRNVSQQPAGLGFLTMDLQSTPAGIYLLQVRTAGGEQVLRIVKQ
ncbi:MAG: alkaline phosphatase D family protein [Bacteroidia bacterium]|nr:alkaline phosphatase D family protein [Bacteroidia bacterium]